MKVLAVRVMNMEGKKQARREVTRASSPDWRKAIVKLNPKDKISFFEGA